MRKSKAPRNSPEKWTFLSLAFYNAPSLDTVDGCSYMAGHEDAGVMTGHIETNTPKFVPPRWDHRCLTLLKRGCANSVVGFELAEGRTHFGTETSTINFAFHPHSPFPKGQQIGRRCLEVVVFKGGRVLKRVLVRDIWNLESDTNGVGRDESNRILAGFYLLGPWQCTLQNT